jgi:hypothetical protein
LSLRYRLDEIIGGLENKERIVIQESDPTVALVAEIAAKLVGLVIMVYA